MLGKLVEQGDVEEQLIHWWHPEGCMMMMMNMMMMTIMKVMDDR